MKISAAGRNQLKEIVRNLTKLVDEEKQRGGRTLTFAELEDDSIEVTDLLAQMLMEERLGDHRSERGATVCCPECQDELARGDDEPRAMLTDRGEVTWTEPTYECRTCRRSFFPGELGIGDRS